MTTINDELREHCKGIANEIEAFVTGSFVRCDECGEAIEYDAEKCPECGCEVCTPEDLTVYDWFESREIFGERVELDFCGSEPMYCGVRLLVACGGPNIWVDTVSGEVRGYWGGDEARVWLDRDACDALDAVEMENIEARGLPIYR